MSWYIKLREKPRDPVIITDDNGNEITIQPTGKSRVVGKIPASIYLTAMRLRDVIEEDGTVGARPTRFCTDLIRVIERENNLEY